MFFTSESGPSTANGPTRTATTPSETAVMTAAARFPSRARARATATTMAGHAVAFIEAAPPKARPASTGRGCRHSSAKPRQMSAMIGTSVPPTASSNAMMGVAVTNTVQRVTSLAFATRRASAKKTMKATPNQTRGSASGVRPATAESRPNAVMAGR